MSQTRAPMADNTVSGWDNAPNPEDMSLLEAVNYRSVKTPPTHLLDIYAQKPALEQLPANLYVSRDNRGGSHLQPPVLLYGWIVNLEDLRTRLLQDIAWHSSDHAMLLLNRRDSSFIEYIKEVDKEFSVEAWIRYKIAGIIQGEVSDSIEIARVYCKTDHSSGDSSYMLSLYSNRTPIDERIKDNHIKQVQDELQIEVSAAWRVRSGYFRWMTSTGFPLGASSERLG